MWLCIFNLQDDLQKIKRFLIPLLAAIALPTSDVSGDLGSADFNYENIPKIYKTEKSEKLSKQNYFLLALWRNSINPRQTSQRSPCKIIFKDGRLIVDNGLGFLPSQVIDWQSGWFQVQKTNWAAHKM